MNRKQHNHEAGYIAERMNPQSPGRKVVIYRSAEQGLDTGDCRYAVVCDTHGSILASRTLPLARSAMKAPESFCEGCRALLAPALTPDDCEDSHFYRPGVL